MPQPAIKRDFLTVSQAANELGVAERTVLLFCEQGALYWEPLDPDKPRSDKIISIASVHKLKEKRPIRKGLSALRATWLQLQPPHSLSLAATERGSEP